MTCLGLSTAVGSPVSRSLGSYTQLSPSATKSNERGMVWNAIVHAPHDDPAALLIQSAVSGSCSAPNVAVPPGGTSAGSRESAAVAPVPPPSSSSLPQAA